MDVSYATDSAEGWKKCTKCRHDKWLHEFRVDKRTGTTMSWCKQCTQRYSKGYTAKKQKTDPAGANAYQKAYRQRRAAEGRPLPSPKTLRGRTLSDL